MQGPIDFRIYTGSHIHDLAAIVLMWLKVAQEPRKKQQLPHKYPTHKPNQGAMSPSSGSMGQYVIRRHPLRNPNDPCAQ